MGDEGRMSANADKDLQSLVDQRVAAKMDALQLATVERLEAALQTRFDRDRAFIGQTLGFATKLLGWVGALAALLLTVFGIKTCADINSAVHSAAIGEVQRRLQVDDPASPFRRDVDRLLSRAVITSYLLTLAQGRSQDYPPPLEVSDADGQRLLSVIMHSETNEKDFRDALEVLSSAANRTLREQKDQVVLELGTATSRRAVWIQEQPTKRAALFRRSRDAGLQPVARAILADPRASDSLVRAAIFYVGRTRDRNAVKDLEARARSQDVSEIRADAVMALAQVAPQSQVLAAWVDTLLRAPKDSEKLLEEIRLASALLQGPRIDSVQRRMASSMIGSAISKGVSFQSEDVGRELSVSVGHGSHDDTVPWRLLFGRGSVVIRSLLKETATAGDMKEFGRLVEAVSLSGRDGNLAVVRVTIRGKGALILKSGQAVDAVAGSNGAIVRPIEEEEEYEDADVASVKWFDASGNPKSGVLVGLRSPKELSFRLTTEVKSRDDAYDLDIEE